MPPFPVKPPSFLGFPEFACSILEPTYTCIWRSLLPESVILLKYYSAISRPDQPPDGFLLPAFPEGDLEMDQSQR
jgi:hypothetical protein